MIPKNIEIVIIKYLTNEANSDELDSLCLWIGNPNNEKLFESYVKLHYEVRLVMSTPDIERIKKNLTRKIKKNRNPFYRYKFGTMLKYAAVVALVMITYFYQKSNIPVTTHQKSPSQTLLVPKNDAVTLVLDNGALQTIKPIEEGEIRDAEGNVIGVQKKSQLNYNKTLLRGEKLTYNTLNVPNGKRFDVILSDGTHVFLNAGTSLKYPVKFLKDSDRVVFLTGEAYFDVAKDKERPFIVHADKMKIRVLGTKFNISHYPEQKNINTVLVAGSVEIYDDVQENGSTATLLTPGFKAQWSKLGHGTTIENVNTRDYTAWVEGKIIFRNSSFLKIRKTLERHFNVKINCNNKDLDQQLFDATFDIESIDEILEAFNKSYAIEYQIVDNQVIIN